MQVLLGGTTREHSPCADLLVQAAFGLATDTGASLASVGVVGDGACGVVAV